MLGTRHYAKGDIQGQEGGKQNKKTADDGATHAPLTQKPRRGDEQSQHAEIYGDGAPLHEDQPVHDVSHMFGPEAGDTLPKTVKTRRHNESDKRNASRTL